MIVYLLIILVGFMVVHYHRMTYWRRKGFPFTEPHLIYGNSQQFFTEQMNVAEQTKDLYDHMKVHPLVGYYVGSFPALLINEPELIKKVLIKDCKYFYDRGLHSSKYVPFLYQNLVSYTGKQWKHIRSKISPTLSQNSMVIIFNKLLTCAEDLKDIMEDSCEKKQPVDIKDIMSRLTLDNIALSSFGIQSNCLKGSNSEFYHNAHIFEQFLFKNIFMKAAVYVPKLMMIAMALTKFGFGKSIMGIRKYFIGVLKNNIKNRIENGVEEKDFLDLFIKMMDKSDNALTFKELAGTAFSFYIGGYHTTETSITFGFLELALYRNVQDKLRKEINEKLDKYEGEVTYDCLMEMKYLDQVINEILRKYPIIPLIVRECNEAYKFEGTDFTVEKGIKVWVSIFALHYDPEYYPDPEKFDPDRFTDEENKKRKPCTYMPFGEGHRTCIGKRLGLLQIKVALVQLLRSYIFTVNEKTIFPVGFEADNIFLAPRNKIWLNVTKIRKN